MIRIENKRSDGYEVEVAGTGDEIIREIAIVIDSIVSRSANNLNKPKEDVLAAVLTAIIKESINIAQADKSIIDLSVLRKVAEYGRKNDS